MKNYILFLSLIATGCLQAQSNFLGIWEGKMNAGVELRMIFTFARDNAENMVVTMDCPDQGISAIKGSKLLIKEDSVYIELGQFNASYRGKLSGDSLISGKFEQGVAMPLNFKRVKSVTKKDRYQTPVGPFPYGIEELNYTNKDKSISYGATITIPEGPGPFPSVLLLTGSGQQNRDEEIMGHKLFAVIADHLTRNGILVLRVDDRGMGSTTGDVAAATSRDFANDAMVSLDYLKKRKEVDPTKIGLIGHSEGGMLAQIIAAERKDIQFIIMLAAPGVQCIRLMEEQNEAMHSKIGFSREYTTAYLELYANLLTTIVASDTNTVTNQITKVVTEWLAKTPEPIVKATTGIRDEKSKNDFILLFISQVNRPWFRYFLAYDPAINLKKLNARVLALNGSNDIQVIAKSNLAGIEAALKEGKSRGYEIMELKGLNHLFQECKSCTANEYGQIEQTIAPTVLELITNWIKKF